MLERLAQALADSGLEAGPEALLDILWLAERLQAAPAAPADEGAAPPPTDPPNTAAPPAAPPPPAPPQRRLPRLDAAPAVGSTRLYARASQGQLRAGVLRVPGVSATPAPVQLRQALRPLNRRVASTERFVLDEEASAERRAETGHWELLLRGVRERWFDLQLVVDTGESMALWAAEIDALQRSLRGQGGFRSLRRFTLGGDGALQLRRDGSAALRPSALAPGGARPLVLLLTDAGAAHWRDGRAQRWLWSAAAVAPLAVMNLLPVSSWRHSPLGVPTGTVWWSRAGEPNAQLRHAVDVLDAPPPDWRAVPLLSLQAASVAAWARAVTAGGGATLPALWVGPDAPPPGLPSRAEATPDQRIAGYRRRVSAAAYELAVFLSVPDPLTLPVMRLVQRAMLPDSGTGELAEYFQGGLLEPLAAHGAPEVWRMLPAVREALTRSLRYSEEAQISAQLRRVGELLERSAATPGAVEALFPSPDGRALLAEWALPFASVSREILGGPAMAAQAPAQQAVSDTAQETDFLDEATVRTTVQQDDRLPPGDSVKSTLGLYFTRTQRTWLVFSAQAISIVLDDANTRSSGRLVQRVMRYDEALPVSPRQDAKAATIGFGTLKGRWYYSRSLFETPERLRGVIAEQVQQHRANATQRIVLDSTPDLAHRLPRLAMALRWTGWRHRLSQPGDAIDAATRISLIGRLPLSDASASDRVAAAGRGMPLLDAFDGREAVRPKVPARVTVEDASDFGPEGALLSALRRVVPEEAGERTHVLVAGDQGHRGRALMAAQRAMATWRTALHVHRHETVLTPELASAALATCQCLLLIIEADAPGDLQAEDALFRVALDRRLDTVVAVWSGLQTLLGERRALAARGGLWSHLIECLDLGRGLFFDDPAHLSRVLQGRDDLHAAAPTAPAGRLLLFTGHTPDTAQNTRQPRFPADQVEVAARAIADAVADQQRRGPVTLACASGSAGGDLLFLESCQDAGIPTRLQLPMEPKLFVDRYLMGERSVWQERFFRVMNRAHTVDVLPDDGTGQAGALAWRRNADTMLSLARQHGAEHSVLLTLWDRGSANFPGGPTYQVEQAREAGIETVVLDTRVLFGLDRPDTRATADSSHGTATSTDLDALEQLASRYDELRRTMPFSNDRTAALTRVVAQMREHARGARPMLRHFQGSQHAGQRLVAIAMLQVEFDPEEGAWLAQRLVDEKPFLGYHAALALLQGLEPLAPAARRPVQTQVARARDQLRDRRVRADVDRDGLIEQILRLPAEPH